MKTLIATDLDRTMIYSRNAFGDLSGATPVCVEHYDGAELSYLTATAADLLARLAALVVVVPTTTRTIAQYERIILPGAPWRYAITSNGGNILVDGRPDRSWRNGIAVTLRADCASLAEVGAYLRSRSGDWVRKFRVADELFCYLVVDLAMVPAEFLADLAAWCGPRGWSVSRQGRKIYAMPEVVCKSRAVAEVSRRLAADGLLAADAHMLAAGDGALDAELLLAADAAIRPRHGELEALSWTSPGITVTASHGITAGEEILRWFLQRAAIG